MVSLLRVVLGCCLAAMLSAGLANATSVTTLHTVVGSSDGNAPAAAPINVGRQLYGTTYLGGTPGYGTVFSVNPSTGAETIVHAFAGGTSDGANPGSGLLNVGGTLYGTTNSGGTSGDGTVFAVDTATGAETVLYSFAGGADGKSPNASLIVINGVLYGTTTLGGPAGMGTVFTVGPATGVERVLHSFGQASDGAYPQGALLSLGGKLYGTTAGGGSSGNGTVFSIDPAADTETVMYAFAGGVDGKFPECALVNAGGMLYGTTIYGGTGSTGYDGTVFSINPATGAHTVVYNFQGGSDGAMPSTLISVDGVLNGATSAGGAAGYGTVFSIDPAAHVKTIIYSFTGGSDGSGPQAGLFSNDNRLYGTTMYGGPANAGTVFAVNPATGAERVFHSFTGAGLTRSSSNALQTIAGSLFLSSSVGGSGNIGDVVEINPSTDAATEVFAFTDKAMGALPMAGLIDGGSVIYGTTESGGGGNCTGGCGTVFSVNPTTGVQNILYSFAGGQDGIAPEAALLTFNNILYGTTSAGGKHGQGTVFTLDPATSTETVLYSFGGVQTGDGSAPVSELINVGGMLYGTTPFGGIGCSRKTGGCGTLYSVNPATGAERVLYSFKKKTGIEPRAALVAVNGTLYGTASGGGREPGAVFSYNPANEVERVLHKFDKAGDGTDPQAALIDVGGVLYGTTSAGGASDKGTVFSINPAKGAEAILYSFTGGSDGGAPNAALVSIGTSFYGTTSSGGAAQRGTVFQFSP